jgi:hypothetical protein
MKWYKIIDCTIYNFNSFFLSLSLSPHAHIYTHPNFKVEFVWLIIPSNYIHGMLNMYFLVFRCIHFQNNRHRRDKFLKTTIESQNKTMDTKSKQCLFFVFPNMFVVLWKKGDFFHKWFFVCTFDSFGGIKLPNLIYPKIEKKNHEPKFNDPWN